MARIRTIKPTFWEDEDIAALSLRARLLFIASWNYADDEGLLRWTPDYIKASVFMYEPLSLKQVGVVMSELEDAGHVYAYRGGRTQQRLAYIPKFLTHQRINRPQESKLPAPSLQSPDVRLMYGNRDGWVCHLCSGDIPRPETPDYWSSCQVDRLSLDHLHPKVKGGADYPSNIKASHLRCNESKGSRTDSVNGSMSRSVSGSPPEGEEGTGNEEKEEGSAGREPRSYDDVLRAGAPPDLLAELDNAVAVLIRSHGIGPVNDALASLLDNDLRYPFPSNVRAELEAILGTPVPRDTTPKCAECGGRFSSGSSWLHSSDCSQARSA